MTHPLIAFEYCPRCGSHNFMINSERSRHCSDCGFTYYSNASASTAAIITNSKGEILLTTRAFEPAKGKLDLPGGFVDMNEIMLDCEIEALERMIWQALSDKEVEHVIDLLNMYGDKQHAHPYVYYCMVRELERITGENLIELVLPVSGI
jgi:ADP-ribose pyrophosphatase YjhB (NUDIX family)